MVTLLGESQADHQNKIKPLIFRGFSSYPKALFPFYSPLNMNNRKNYIVYLQQSAMKQEECQDPKQRYKKIIQTYSTDRNRLLKITIPQPIKRKAIHATTYFAQLVWKIKYFFLTFVLGFISNLNKNRALRHYPSSGNRVSPKTLWIC